MSNDFICIPSVRGLILEETAAFVSDTEREREKAERSKCKIENKEEKENGWGNVCFLLFCRKEDDSSRHPETNIPVYIYL